MLRNFDPWLCTNLMRHFQPGHHVVRSIPSSIPAGSTTEPAPEIEYCEVLFTNCTYQNIDIMWKEAGGVETVIKENLKNGDSFRKLTLLTHQYLARDSETHRSRSFNYQTTKAVVFEALKFDVPSKSVAKVVICKRGTKLNELGMPIMIEEYLSLILLYMYFSLYIYT